MVCGNINIAPDFDISSGQQMVHKEEAEDTMIRVKIGEQEENVVELEQLSQAIEQYLIQKHKMDAEVINALNIVMMKSPQRKKVLDFRVFDTEEAEAIKVTIKDYVSLNTHPELILYDGWIDEDSNHVEMTEKRAVEHNVPLLTTTEIKQEIEALNEPGSTVFFYQARGHAYGGPLGKGALIVELNPAYKERKVSKYIIYTSNMVGKNLVGESRRLWRSNSAEKTAELIKVAQHRRVY
ncbi:hypothetical protein ACFL1Z_04545 [Thermodesulfobacteriota bacterium]